MGPGAMFLAICMAIIAAAAGAAVYVYLGVSTLEAATVAVATLTSLVLYHLVSSRVGLRSMVGRQFADLSRGSADVARQVAEMERRVAALEGKIETALDHALAVTDPLTAEIEEVGTLVKRLAQTVEGQQTRLDALGPTPSKPPAAFAAPIAAEPFTGALDQPASPSHHADKDGTAAAAKAGPDAAAISAAVDANRIDLYLQPIVTLPQRKVRYYEATARLRNDVGETFPPRAFIPQAESGGLMPKVDNVVMFRCVALVRRLLLKNRDIGMFCNLSAKTLTDAAFLPQLLDFMAANRAIAPWLVFQFSHEAVAAMSAAEHEGLAALSERGFRFSMDGVSTLRLDPGELVNRGFRYIKAHADLLLKRARPIPTDIRPAELSDLLGRFGIDLIVDRIDDERSVIDLLDHDVRYGQGSLFSPPRPARPEALQAYSELSDAGTNERSAETNRSVPVHVPAPSSDPPEPATDSAGPGTAAQIVRGVMAGG
jgi:cyclic-di-GMP phosphodiesterase, flagellum assembly factor TipF